MQNKILSRSILLTSLLIAVSACSSMPAKQQAQAEPAPSVKQVPVTITAKIDKSGVAEPIRNHGNVVGYKYKRSFLIPAAKGNFFGFSYKANQQLQLTTADNKVTSEVLSHVPVTVKVIHPAITQANGSVTTESSWQDTLYFGRPNHSIWQFEAENELVEGKWSISVIHQDKTLIEKNFLVKKVRPRPKKVTQVCTADESQFPPPLAKDHQACCQKDDVQACYNFAWRALERLNDMKGAVLYYGRGCELGDASSCRTAGKIAKDETEQKKWFEKGCELKDLDSCLEIGKTPY